MFLEEARFYELGKRIVNKLEQPFFVRRNKTVGTMKQKIWYTLDDPASSTIAKGIAFFDLVISGFESRPSALRCDETDIVQRKSTTFDAIAAVHGLIICQLIFKYYSNTASSEIVI